MSNQLHIGLNEKPLPVPDERFLLLADPSLAETAQELFPKAKLFDPHLHSFNPLRGINEIGVRDFAETVYSAFPQGQNTLTVRYGKSRLAKMLVNTTRLDKFPQPNKDDLGEVEAARVVEDILFSPLMRKVLCDPPNFSFKGSIIAKLDRAELGRFDTFLLGALLASQFKGQIIVPDFGFYACPFYLSFKDQDRLIVGLNYLGEVSKELQDAVVSIKDKHFYGLIRPDAERLIFYTNNPAGNPSDLM